MQKRIVLIFWGSEQFNCNGFIDKTDENCKFIKFARIFTYERQFGKRKSMLFLTILSKKNFHSVRGKNIILLTILLNILFCGKKNFYCRFCVKKNYSEEKFYFREYEILFFFLNRTLSTGVRKYKSSKQHQGSKRRIQTTILIFTVR